MTKNVVVTGGAGYIGSVLVPQLLSQGHRVTVIDAMYFGCNLQPHKNLSVLDMDIFNADEGDLRGHDSVIHLSGLSNDPMAAFNPGDNFVQNLSGASYIAWLARRSGVEKFIFAGSCSVYGMNNHITFSESDDPVSDFPYAVSKRQAEQSLLQLARHDFEVCVLRKATVFGYAPRMRTDLVVNAMTKNAIVDGAIYMNDSSLSRPLIYIGDLCDIYCKLLQVHKPLPEIINVANENYTVLEIADQVKDSLLDKIPNLTIVDKKLKDLRSYRVNTELLDSTIGQRQTTTIKQAVDELVDRIPLDDLTIWTDPNWINVEMYKQRLHNDRK